MNTITVMSWESFVEEHGPNDLISLEKECWAPWLAASAESLIGRISVFSEGQICAVEDGKILASLSLNKINWSGEADDLPSWDQVAGDPTDYSATYQETGNALVAMSMNVSGIARGMRMPSILLNAAVEYAKNKNVQYVVGSFRPSQYGDAVLHALKQGTTPPSFEEYIATNNEEGLPVDAWLRTLARNGMKMVKVDTEAMVVPMNDAEYKTYAKDDWLTFGLKSFWRGRTVACGETGFFYGVGKHDGTCTYKESNVWGVVYDAAKNV
jgi:hypothetical protein